LIVDALIDQLHSGFKAVGYASGYAQKWDNVNSYG